MTAQPVLDARVATPLAQQPMRRLQTSQLRLYYPAEQKDVAVRVARRLERCVAELRHRARIHSASADRKLSVLMPGAPINNAFVYAPIINVGPFSVVPTFATSDLVVEVGLPSDPAFISCHEAVHYVHFLQMRGAWGWLAKTFGDLTSPQLGLEPWFHEGIATYYESRLQPGRGRMAWPGWRGLFHAAYAGRDVSGGDLNPAKRPLRWGNHYLVGSHFVEFLVERYGEEHLWQLIDCQGGSFFFLLFVSQRFRAVYGKSLPALVAEFSDYVKERLPRRQRPPQQATIRGLGVNARYATSPGGREAVISSSEDRPPRLLIYDAGGRVLRRRNLIAIMPPRALAWVDPVTVSGLSFTADENSVFFVTLDPGSVQLKSRLVRYDIAGDELSIVASDLGGPGGGIDSTGQRFYFGFADGDRHHLAVHDVATGAQAIVVRADAGTYFRTPRVSPDGRAIAAAVLTETGQRIDLYDASSGDRIASWNPGEGPVHDPWFIDDGRLLFLATKEGRFQVHTIDVRTGVAQRATDAPYLALNPRPHRGRIRFLNRMGWHWTLDEVAAPAAAGRGALAAAATEPGEAATLTAAAPGPPRPLAAAPADPDAVSIIDSDSPYSPFDRLFLPRAHLLSLLALGTSTSWGLGLGGWDELQYHRWAVSGFYNTTNRLASGLLEYANHRFAPLTAVAAARTFAWQDTFATGDAAVRLDRRQWSAGGTVARTFRTTTLWADFSAVDDRRQESPSGPFLQRRMTGLGLGLDHAGRETTPYGGTRRAFALSASGFAYPDALTSLRRDFADVRAALAANLPTPPLRRGSIALALRTRSLPGLAGDRFLQVGGAAPFTVLYRDSNRPDAPAFRAPALPPGFRFFEPLRGYEDLALAVDRIAIADFSIRHPLIIDRGGAALLWIFPSWFVRQLDLDAFAALAADGLGLGSRGHGAAGGALGLRFLLGPLELQCRYQFARRLADDNASVHLVTITL